MISAVNVEVFVKYWIARKQMSKLFQRKFVEQSYLSGKLATSTNFDSWFTYCVLSQQNSVSVEIVL